MREPKLPPPMSKIDRADPQCANCDGEGWVCENHPEVPWGNGDGCCMAAGAPCSCNPLHRNNWTEEIKARHKWCNEQNSKMAERQKK